MMESEETDGSGWRVDTYMRRFDVSLLRDHREEGAIAALFDRWVLPGESAGTHGLRVAIRNGHLNFYVKGQSVGALRLVAGRPRLRLHRKYKAAAENGSRRAAALGQTYETLDADALKTTSADIVDGWIRTAETYAGDEKRFVDDLVAVTPGTIDLEMGLAADEDAVGEDRTAPRMDLVVAQGSAIAFWEAKCAVNGELRARAAYRESPKGRYEAGPHVLWQLRRYERWVGRPHRLGQVRDAYVESARILIALAALFGKRGPAIEAWTALARAGKPATVILPPGIVIADYCPVRADGATRAESATYAARAGSFGEHSARLMRHGATVVSVPAKPHGPVLPDLRVGRISAAEAPAG